MSDRVRITSVALALCLCASMSVGQETPAPSAEAPLEVSVSGYSYSSAVLDTQAKLRKTQAVKNPKVRQYMDLVDAGLADSNDLESFGNFLTERGFLELAVVYSKEALRFDPDNAHFWTNLGTIQRQMGDDSAAIDSYLKAIAIDPGMAIAQYNLGVCPRPVRHSVHDRSLAGRRERQPAGGQQPHAPGREPAPLQAPGRQSDPAADRPGSDERRRAASSHPDLGIGAEDPTFSPPGLL